MPPSDPSSGSREPREGTPPQPHGTADAALARTAAELEACRAALHSAEMARRALEDAAAEYAVLATDLRRRITLWSEGALRLFGHEAHEVLGRSDDLLFTPEDRAAGVPEAELRVVLSDGRTPNEHWFQRRDGSRFWGSGVLMKLRWSGDEAVGFVRAVRDVTERRHTEATLRESEARFRALFDAAPVIMWVTDAEGRCTHINRRWSEFTGQTEAGALGHGWLDMVHPDDRARLEAVFRGALARREGFRAEERLRRADGAWRWAYKTAEPHFAEDGTYLGHIGSWLDITDRKEAEERQALLVRELDHRAKNTLAVVQAAIELTPAADVQSFTEAIKGRVAALARAHALLAAGRWSGADLRALLEAELFPFLGADPAGNGRTELDGPELTLAPHAAQALSMVVHELATNATKHGALSAPGGRVSVSWRLDPVAGVLRLRWTEEGGPPIVGEPRQRGFGSRVIETTVRRQLGGTLFRAWAPTGLLCELAVPLARTVAGQGIHRAA